MNLNEFEKAQIAYNELQLKENIDDRFVKDFYKILVSNKEEMKKILEIEKKYENFYNSIETIFENIKNMKKYDFKEEQRKREDGFIVGKYKESLGVLGIIFNGNPYVTIELSLKAIFTKNAIIFCTNNKMFAITKLIIMYLGQVLEQNGYSKELLQVINNEDYEEMYKHDAILRKIIVVGDKDLQNEVIAKSNIEVITSGYDCFDLYIENILDEKLIKKILKVKNIDLNIYISKNISEQEIENLDIEDYTEIESVDEVIRDININSASYGSSIFTSNGENANKFLKLVKSKNVFVNTSPTLERVLDIKEKDLLYTKQVFYKNN